MVKEIERVAPGKKLLAVIYSHHHQDHATGANVLRAALGTDAPIIAHENAFAPINAANTPDQPLPTIRFKKEMTLYFGNRPIELHYLGRSHSDDMIVALLPENKLAFAVDFVSADGVGFRDLPEYYFPDLFMAMRRLVELDFDRIAFGHGRPGDRAAVFRQIRYYDDLREAVEKAVDAGMTEDEAASRIRLDAYKDWRGYEDWFPLNVRAMYRWLKKTS